MLSRFLLAGAGAITCQNQVAANQSACIQISFRRLCPVKQRASVCQLKAGQLITIIQAGDQLNFRRILSQIFQLLYRFCKGILPCQVSKELFGGIILL